MVTELEGKITYARCRAHMRDKNCIQSFDRETWKKEITSET